MVIILVIAALVVLCVLALLLTVYINSRPRWSDFDADQSPFDYAEPSWTTPGETHDSGNGSR